MAMDPGMLPPEHVQRGLDRLAEIYDPNVLAELSVLWANMAVANQRGENRTVGTLGDLDVVHAPADWWIAIRAMADAIRAHPAEWADLVDVVAETEERRVGLREWGQHLSATHQ